MVTLLVRDLAIHVIGQGVVMYELKIRYPDSNTLKHIIELL